MAKYPETQYTQGPGASVNCSSTLRNSVNLKYTNHTNSFLLSSQWREGERIITKIHPAAKYGAERNSASELSSDFLISSKLVPSNISFILQPLPSPIFQCMKTDHSLVGQWLRLCSLPNNAGMHVQSLVGELKIPHALRPKKAKHKMIIL